MNEKSSDGHGRLTKGSEMLRVTVSRALSAYRFHFMHILDWRQKSSAENLSIALDSMIRLDGSEC